MGGRGAKYAKSTSMSLPPIDVDSRWAFQPDDATDLSDMRKNPIPYVGVGKDKELFDLFEGDRYHEVIQRKYLSNVTVNISELYTLQPFVLQTGISDYKPWDENSERPYIIEFEGKKYVMDGNHRVAIAKLKGQRTIEVDVSLRERR